MTKVPGLDELVTKTATDLSSEQFTWFANADGASPTLNIGVHNPTQTDASKLQSATGVDDRIDGYKVELSELPVSLEALQASQDQVLETADGLGIPVATQVRPDIGRIVVSVPQETSEKTRTALEADTTECSVVVESGDPFLRLRISRADMPPYKGGKRINTRILQNGELVAITLCSTAFVFESDGPGQQPLWGSTAGHCVQGQQDVFDDQASGALTKIGRTVLPNLFFASSPAIGDSVQIDLSIPRADVTRKVIVTSSTEVTVVGHIAPINIAMGTLVCASGGLTANAWCGGMARYDVTLSTQYRDYFAGQIRTKNIQNMYCFNGSSGQDGDSGTAIYRSVAPFNVKAVGIYSGDAFSPLDTCFTSTVLLGGQTDTHVWTGD